MKRKLETITIARRQAMLLVCMLYAVQNSEENEKLSFLYAFTTAALKLRHQTYEEVLVHMYINAQMFVYVCMVCQGEERS